VNAAPLSRHYPPETVLRLLRCRSRRDPDPAEFVLDVAPDIGVWSHIASSASLVGLWALRCITIRGPEIWAAPINSGGMITVSGNIKTSCRRRQCAYAETSVL
jgi:hypothetical protein